ncbi:MAG TPA: hypothetical protein VNH18_15895 [Bryobacteraceae bacterium]|nr:hypothetical protein [Bryobacteraceae bacterium]
MENALDSLAVTEQLQLAAAIASETLVVMFSHRVGPIWQELPAHLQQMPSRAATPECDLQSSF